MRLDTERFFLRTLKPADATDVYAAWLNDTEINRFLETRHAVQSVDSCRDYIENMNMDPASHLFGIFLQAEGRHIGNAKLGFINPHYRSGQISLFIGDKACWGQGLGGEVVRTLSAYGFRDLGLERLEAGCYEDNLASLRAFLKNGYVVEGFFRRHVVVDERRCGVFWLGLLKHEFV